MKICVCENLNAKKPLDQSLTELKAAGIEAVEIGCGGYPGNDHANAEILRIPPSRHPLKRTSGTRFSSPKKRASTPSSPSRAAPAIIPARNIRTGSPARGRTIF